MLATYKSLKQTGNEASCIVCTGKCSHSHILQILVHFYNIQRSVMGSSCTWFMKFGRANSIHGLSALEWHWVSGSSRVSYNYCAIVHPPHKDKTCIVPGGPYMYFVYGATTITFWSTHVCLAQLEGVEGPSLHFSKEYSSKAICIFHVYFTW